MRDVTSRPLVWIWAIWLAVMRPACCVSSVLTRFADASTTTLSPSPTASLMVPTERRVDGASTFPFCSTVRKFDISTRIP